MYEYVKDSSRSKAVLSFVTKVIGGTGKASITDKILKIHYQLKQTEIETMKASN